MKTIIFVLSAEDAFDMDTFADRLHDFAMNSCGCSEDARCTLMGAYSWIKHHTENQYVSIDDLVVDLEPTVG